MSEHMSPIPSRLYNAAVGGHVAGADQIIDDKTGLTLDKVTGGALEEKEYTSGSNNGMGRVVLRKNLVNGVNTLTQSIINKSNTIYVIQYDFTLASDVTIPANCVLEFDGGSISGAYTITGNDTQIKAQDVTIFNNGIVIAGTWNCSRIVSDWFSDVTLNNRVRQLFNLCNDNVYNEVYIEEGTYHLSIAAKWETAILLNNTKLHLDGTILVDSSNNVSAYQTIEMSSNSAIVGKGKIIGDEAGLPITDRQNCFGIIIGSQAAIKPNNVYVDGIEISNFDGDGIYVRFVKDVYIRNVYIHDTHRQGLTLEDVSNITVDNCRFENILQQGASYAAIDIEPEQNTYVVSNVTITKCTFNTCNQAVIIPDNTQSVPTNIRIEDCVINTTSNSIQILGGDCIFIINNYIHKGLGSKANNMHCLNNRFRGAGITMSSYGKNCYIKNNTFIGNTTRYAMDITIYGENNFIEDNYIESGEDTQNLFHINLNAGSKNCVVVNNLSKPILTGTDAGYTKENIHNEGTDNFIGTNYNIN